MISCDVIGFTQMMHHLNTIDRFGKHDATCKERIDLQHHVLISQIRNVVFRASNLTRKYERMNHEIILEEINCA